MTFSPRGVPRQGRRGLAVNPARFVYGRIGDPRKREAAARFVSFVCRVLGVETLEGRVNGVPVFLSSQDNWGLRKFYFKDGFDRREIETLRGILKTEGRFVFWDIGANYGAYALSLYPDAAAVVAVEPSARTFRHLRQSFAARGASAAVLENCAAGDGSNGGESVLYLSEEHSGDHRTYAPAGDERRRERIQKKTVDQIAAERFSDMPRRNILKIDVQGDEISVLKGARRLIEQSEKLYLLLEIWPKGLLETGGSVGELIDLCRVAGLRPLSRQGAEDSWDRVTSALDVSGKDSGWINVLLKK